MSDIRDICDPDCSCRGQGLPLLPGQPGYDSAVMRALDLIVGSLNRDRASDGNHRLTLLAEASTQRRTS